MPLSDPSTPHGQNYEAQTLLQHPSGWHVLEHVLGHALQAMGHTTQSASVILLRVALQHTAFADNEADWQTTCSLAQQAQHRLLSALPEGTQSISLSSTQLALVLTPLAPDETLQDILVTAEAALSGSVEIEGVPLAFDALMGASTFPDNGDSARALMTAANAALFEARIENGSAHAATQQGTKAYTDHVLQDHALRRAIAFEDIHLEFLPVMESTSERIIGFEARPLWVQPDHAEDNLASPVSLRQASRLGLIEALNIWTLKTACEQALTWSQPLGVSVSISPTWLEHERLSETLRALLANTGFPAQRLQLELSDRHYFSAPEIARKELSRIRAMGVRLALDKFGTGYSSLERLKHYPFDQVKLDSTFTHNILEDWRAQALLRSILHLIASLDMRCCATGVETQEQFAFLAVNGCQEVQGKVAGPSIESC